MNYIWIGLIIIAILYAASKDLTGDRPTVQYDPNLISGFTSSDSADLDLDSSIFFKADRKPVWNEEDTSSAKVTLEGGSSQIDIPVGISIEKSEEKGTPDSITFSYYSESADVRIYPIYTDADGEQYAPTNYKTLSTPEDSAAVKWTPYKTTFSEMMLLGTNLVAVPDFPLELSSIRVTGINGQEIDPGIFYVDHLFATYPTKSKVSDSLTSQYWVGVVTKSSARWAELSITLALNLIGIMMLWLGLMNIAKQAGLIEVIARMLKPIMKHLFPGIPPEGPAMGAIVMNIAANMLGLGNAATPLGIKAMEELQEINENKEYASNAQCMLLAMNTSSVTLIPASIIGYRAAEGSENLMIFLPVMIMSTLISTIFAVTACKILEKLPNFQVPEPSQASAEGGQT